MVAQPLNNLTEFSRRLSRALTDHFVISPATEPHLAAVISGALENPGRLFRATLVWRMLTSLGHNPELADALSCAVEYFHLASLLLDDLPCMDDATIRRGRPCPHLEHGEATVILAALGFINRAYFLTWRALASLPAERQLAAGACLDRHLGATGILDGQARDLRFGEKAREPREIAQIALGKTVALFHLALEFPALVGGATRGEQKLLRRLGVTWGLFYQACDDLADYTRSDETRESTGRDALFNHPNLLVALRPAAFTHRLDRLERQARENIEKLCSLNPAWSFLAAAHQTLITPVEVPPGVLVLSGAG